MNQRPACCLPATALTILLLALAGSRAKSFRVATFNVENYLDEAAGTRHVKTAEARAKVRESILALKPDVLALEEMGSLSAQEELRNSLGSHGLDFPFVERVTGFDTNIHVVILSRFPFSARRPQTNDAFLLDGRRFRVSRGFGEEEVQVTTNYSFTLIAAHLKSKRPIPLADEGELRLEEAKVLREKIDQRFAADPNANLLVVGDLNDTKDSKSTKEIIGRGKHKLVDTRPSERNGDDLSGRSARERRTISWTHYYGVEDTYSRIDYILLSPGMARRWVTNESYVLAMPNWGIASDHRPILATFETGEP